MSLRKRNSPALYAISDDDYGGRAHREPDDPLRTPFELDRHRIIESTAFRRLENKTQVFAPAFHDHFRTRLTHTLEVAQVARTLAVMLGANAALTEAIALGHDLGHPPFGHVGEAALAEAMADHGGFNHNVHALRVVEYLEHPFPAFRGLNLTGRTRAGLAEHATRYDRPADTAATGCGASGPSVEAQIASIADRVAFNCHDLEDAIGAGFLGLDALQHVALWRESYEAVSQHLPNHSVHAVRRVVLDAMLDAALGDIVQTSGRHLAAIRSPAEAQASPGPVVAFSKTVNERLEEVERFLLERVYRHPEVGAMDRAGRKLIVALFTTYRETPQAMPGRFALRIDEQGLERVVCDYIAGMTDRFCRAECERLGVARCRD